MVPYARPYYLSHVTVSRNTVMVILLELVTLYRDSPNVCLLEPKFILTGLIGLYLGKTNRAHRLITLKYTIKQLSSVEDL